MQTIYLEGVSSSSGVRWLLQFMIEYTFFRGANLLEKEQNTVLFYCVNQNDLSVWSSSGTGGTDVERN